MSQSQSQTGFYWVYFSCGCALKMYLYENMFACVGHEPGWNFWYKCEEHNRTIVGTQGRGQVPDNERYLIKKRFLDAEGVKNESGYFISKPKRGMVCRGSERLENYRLDLLRGVEKNKSKWAPDPNNISECPRKGYQILYWNQLNL